MAVICTKAPYIHDQTDFGLYKNSSMVSYDCYVLLQDFSALKKCVRARPKVGAPALLQ